MRNLFYLAKQWASAGVGSEPEKDNYCANSSVFKTKLDQFEWQLKQEKSFHNIYSLITSVVGEIGNNSFDHNLGNWIDIPGVYFAYDLQKKIIVLADRGQGILQTLKKVKPELNTHSEALQTAFTEVLTGRAPEHRGNGLKYVKQIVNKYSLGLVFYTGDAKLNLPNLQSDLEVLQSDEFIPGCLALIQFDS